MGKENQSFKQVIQSYLEQRAKGDSLFATSFAKPNKNIDECCNYLVGEARKRGGNVVCMSDDEVFGLAIHYYDEDNIKVDKQAGYKATTSNTKNPKKEQQSSKLPLPKEETPTYIKRKGKEKKVSSSTQFLLFDDL